MPTDISVKGCQNTHYPLFLSLIVFNTLKYKGSAFVRIKPSYTKSINDKIVNFQLNKRFRKAYGDGPSLRDGPLFMGMTAFRFIFMG